MEVGRRRQGLPTRVVERRANKRPVHLPTTHPPLQRSREKETKYSALLHPTFLSDASPAAESQRGRNRPCLSANHSRRDQSIPLKSSRYIDRLRLRSSRLPALLDFGVSQPESRMLSDGKPRGEHLALAENPCMGWTSLSAVPRGRLDCQRHVQERSIGAGRGQTCSFAAPAN